MTLTHHQGLLPGPADTMSLRRPAGMPDSGDGCPSLANQRHIASALHAQKSLYESYSAEIARASSRFSHNSNVAGMAILIGLHHTDARIRSVTE